MGEPSLSPPPPLQPQEGVASQALPYCHLPKSGSSQQLFPPLSAPCPGTWLILMTFASGPAQAGWGSREAGSSCPLPSCSSLSLDIHAEGPGSGHVDPRMVGGAEELMEASVPTFWGVGGGVCEAGSPKCRSARGRDPGLGRSKTHTGLGAPLVLSLATPPTPEALARLLPASLLPSVERGEATHCPRCHVSMTLAFLLRVQLPELVGAPTRPHLPTRVPAAPTCTPSPDPSPIHSASSIGDCMCKAPKPCQSLVCTQ